MTKEIAFRETSVPANETPLTHTNTVECNLLTVPGSQLAKLSSSFTIHCSTGAVAIPPLPPTFESYSLSLFWVLSPFVSCSRTQSALTFLCFQRHLAVRYWTFFQILSAKNVFYLVTIEYYVFNIQEKLELKTDNHKYTHIQKRQLKKIQKMDIRCYSFTRW